MTKSFRKNIFRTIRQSLGRYLAILAISALGIGFFAGFRGANPSMIHTARVYLEEVQLFDFQLISTWGFTSKEVEMISDLANVDLAVGAYSVDFIYLTEDYDRRVFRARSITEQINLLSLIEGEMPTAGNQIVLDASFFDAEMIGQEIRLSSENNEDVFASFIYDTFLVTGLVRSPLYLNLERGTTTLGSGQVHSFVYLLPEAFYREFYNHVFVSTTVLELAFTPAYREAIEAIEFPLEESVIEISKSRFEDMTTLLQMSGITDGTQLLDPPAIFVLDRNSNVGYAYFENDIDIVASISQVFPLFFVLIAALVFSTTMTRMVDDEHTQIGVFGAIGYKPRTILSKFILYAASAAFIGGLIGFIIGTRLFPHAIWMAYSILYTFADDLILVVDYTMLFICLSVAVLCSAGTAFLACRVKLRHLPATMIRPIAPAGGKRILLERISFIWKKLPFLYKVTARNIFRFKKRMFMMVIGISGCMSLVLAGLGLRDSITGVLEQQYTNVLHFDLNASFSHEIEESIVTDLKEQYGDYITHTSLVMQRGVNAILDVGNKTTTLLVDQNGELEGSMSFQLAGETIPRPAEGEVIIDTRLANAGNFDVGDEIIFQLGDTFSSPVIISGIFENYIFYYAYMTADTYESIFNDYFFKNSLFISLIDLTNEHYIVTWLGEQPNFIRISITSRFIENVGNMLNSFNYVVLLVIASAGLLAFIVLFNLGNINIYERIREIATLKVLGFYPRETSAYVFRENFVLSLIGIVVGVPLGIALHRFIMSQFQIDMLSFQVVIHPISFILAPLIVLFFSIIVDLILKRKLERIQMVESLKSVE